MRWRQGVVTPQAAALRVGVRLEKPVGTAGAKLYTVPANTTVEEAAAAMRSMPGERALRCAVALWRCAMRPLRRRSPAPAGRHARTHRRF